MGGGDTELPAASRPAAAARATAATDVEAGAEAAAMIKM